MDQRSRLGGALALTLVVGTSTWALGASPARAAQECVGQSSPLYFSIESTLRTGLATPWKKEHDNSLKLGFDDANSLGNVSLTAGEGRVAIHRLYRKGDFVTAPESDVSTWLGRGYTDQGVRFHAAPSWASCGVAVRRVVDAKGFHQEVLERDVAALTAQGWTDVGVKYRVNPLDDADVPPPSPVVDPGVPAPQPPPPAATGADADGRFSIAVVPDTQNEVLRPKAPLLVARNTWLAQHRGADDLDLRAVLQVGDLTNWDTETHDQYANAQVGMKPLENAQIPWVGAVGNHDNLATGEGGSARPGVNPHVALRDTTTYNTWFDASHFIARTATETPGKQENSVHMFSAGGLDWMVVAIEVWPRADKLQWAARQVAANPNRNVILVTHDYLDWGGGVQAGNDGYGDLPPTKIREQIVAKYPNVKFVFSGHEGVGAVKVEDFNGNRVVAMQQNYDTNTDNLTRLVEINATNGSLVHSFRSVSTPRVHTPDTTISGMTWVR